MPSEAVSSHEAYKVHDEGRIDGLGCGRDFASMGTSLG